VDFATFVLSQLAPRSRVLEVGCGKTGELALTLAAADHDVVAIDPRAPEGSIFRRVALEEFDEDGTFDAAVCKRVLHHVEPLPPAVEKLARLAPVVLVEEFAHERLDEPTRAWYEGQHRLLAAAGVEADGPPDLGHWREEHRDLHPSGHVLSALDACFARTHYEDRPYLYRWLGGPKSEELEQMLIDAGAIRPLGFRYAGTRTETTRSEANSR
jgi:ubiquinone/menaquinone biosynthesis C-methylase UbiE